jgi:hypothetical protein
MLTTLPFDVRDAILVAHGEYAMHKFTLNIFINRSQQDVFVFLVILPTFQRGMFVKLAEKGDGNNFVTAKRILEAG